MQRIAIAAFAASLAQAWAADPADPGASVPAPQYRSVFQDTPKGVEEGSDDWKKANAEVGRFPRGHADILKWENARQPAAPRPTAPASAPPGHKR